MAKKRTKVSKQHTVQRRQLATRRPVVEFEEKQFDLISYDQRLILHDMTKTLLATVVVFGVLVALYLAF